MTFNVILTLVILISILVLTWIATHPPKPTLPRKQRSARCPSSSQSQPSLADTPAPSPIPTGTKAILVIILLIATIAAIIRYAITHH